MRQAKPTQSFGGWLVDTLKYLAKIAASLLLVLFVIGAVASIGMAVGLGGMCANTEVRRVLSPDGRRAAILFERNCGATTGFTSQVSVLSANGKPRKQGNVIIADDHNGAVPVGDWGGPLIVMEWLGPEELHVIYDPRARVDIVSEKVGRVEIKFTTDETPDTR